MSEENLIVYFDMLLCGLAFENRNRRYKKYCKKKKKKSK